MTVSNSEKQELIKCGAFLTEMGFKRSDYEYMENYTLDNISICVAYPPCSDESDITIRYADTNQIFSVSWIAFVRNGMETRENKFKKIKTLLAYVRDNIVDLLDYQYCLDSNKLVDKYVDEHRQIFDRAVSDFLSKK